MLSGARPSFLRALRVSFTEARAFARQAVLLPRDVERPVIPRDVAPSEEVVVVLHGLFATAGVLRPLRAKLERAGGVRTATLSYAPHVGVREVAARVVKLLAKIPETARVHLVGHSMGGVVARYVAVTAEDSRIVHTVALASPFGGLRGASLLSVDVARDMEPESEVLRTIRTSQRGRAVPHLSILAGSDALFKNPIVHALPDGEVVVLPDRGHNALLFDEECLDIVDARVRAHLGRDGDSLGAEAVLTQSR
jgi:hypothetical protein